MTATAEKCLHETTSGPCWRPKGHTPNGHASKATLDKKAANAKGRDVSPEALRAAEADRAAKALARIEAAEAAEVAKLDKLKAAAFELGFKLVPLTKKELADAAKAQTAAESAESAE